MRPLTLEGMIQFGKPVNWDDAVDGPCNALPVIKTGSVHTSVWAFSDQERQLIAEGQNLTLTCVGLQPPVLLTVAPIKDGPPEVIAIGDDSDGSNVPWFAITTILSAVAAIGLIYVASRVVVHLWPLFAQ